MMANGKAPGLVTMALLLAAACWPAGSNAQDLEDAQGLQGALEDIGREYALGYIAPLAHAFGANQNSGLFTTAAIPGSRLTFSFGIKVMNARLAVKDQRFRRVIDATLDESYGVQPGDPGYGEQGVVEIAGPTFFGSEDEMGSITAYYLGVPVGQREGIEGVWESRNAPLALPEASLGGIAGFKATVRWLPEFEISEDVGKLKLFGYGLQYGINQFFPLFPLDVTVGFFRQSLDIGDVASADASSYFVAASHATGILTLYGGLALESSDMEFSYRFRGDPDEGIPAADVAFEIEGRQEKRFTLGAAIKMGVQLNAEVGFGDALTTYSAGLMFGI